MMFFIEEHVRQLVEVENEQKNKLGMQNMMLGNNFISGDKVESFSNKFRVNIDNLTISEFYQFCQILKSISIFKS